MYQTPQISPLLKIRTRCIVSELIITEDLLRMKSARFSMEISFDGTAYSGWQSQSNSCAVQDILEEKISLLFGMKVKTTGSSRTDSGVHALGFAVSFDAPEKENLPPSRIKDALNSLLPPDIRINSVSYTEASFHARYSALAKAYTYVINTGDASPFDFKWTLRRSGCRNIDAIKEALPHIVGTHDFSAFTVKRSAIDNPVRTIYSADAQFLGKYLCITLVGNGFLYKMVRCIVGAMVEVGENRLSPDAVKTILESLDRGEAPATAPPHGLFLMKVFYEEGLHEKFHLEKLPFFYDLNQNQ